MASYLKLKHVSSQNMMTARVTLLLIEFIASPWLSIRMKYFQKRSNPRNPISITVSCKTGQFSRKKWITLIFYCPAECI